MAAAKGNVKVMNGVQYHQPSHALGAEVGYPNFGLVQARMNEGCVSGGKSRVRVDGRACMSA